MRSNPRPQRARDQDYIGPNARTVRPSPNTEFELTWRVEHVESNAPSIWLHRAATDTEEPADIGWVTLHRMHRSTQLGECEDAVDRVIGDLKRAGIRKAPLLYRTQESWLRAQYHNRKLGRFMYEKLLRILAVDQPVILVADACGGTETSHEARSVYASLLKDYIGEGLAISSVPRPKRKL